MSHCIGKQLQDPPSSFMLVGGRLRIGAAFSPKPEKHFETPLTSTSSSETQRFSSRMCQHCDVPEVHPVVKP